MLSSHEPRVTKPLAQENEREDIKQARITVQLPSTLAYQPTGNTHHQRQSSGGYSRSGKQTLTINPLTTFPAAQKALRAAGSYSRGHPGFCAGFLICRTTRHQPAPPDYSPGHRQTVFQL